MTAKNAKFSNSLAGIRTGLMVAIINGAGFIAGAGCSDSGSFKGVATKGTTKPAAPAASPQQPAQTAATTSADPAQPVASAEPQPPADAVAADPGNITGTFLVQTVVEPSPTDLRLAIGCGVYLDDTDLSSKVSSQTYGCQIDEALIDPNAFTISRQPLAADQGYHMLITIAAKEPTTSNAEELLATLNLLASDLTVSPTISTSAGEAPYIPANATTPPVVQGPFPQAPANEPAAVEANAAGANTSPPAATVPPSAATRAPE